MAAQEEEFTPAIWLPVVSWGVMVLLGLVSIAAYSNTPGSIDSVGMHWPQNSSLVRSTEQTTAVLFLHPRCACSHSTLREFERIIAKSAVPITVKFVFYVPQGEAESWADTKLKRLADRISPGNAVLDFEGAEAARFGAVTSGHGFVFSSSGETLFSGGITASRAHEGANVGATGMRQSIEGRSDRYVSTPVFGCPIRTVVGQKER